MGRVTTDDLYGADCPVYLVESEGADFYGLAIHEKRDDRCPGDPNTAPIVDRLRVQRRRHDPVV